METLLPEEIEQAGEPVTVHHSTDGIAGALATEFNADNGTAGGEGNSQEPARRPGRPPIHGLYSKSAGSDGKHPVRSPGEEEIPPAHVETGLGVRACIPPDMLAEIVQEGLVFAETYAQSKIEAVAIKAGLEKAHIIPQLQQAQISPKRKELLGKLAPLVLEEWGIDPQMSPTLAAGVLLGPPMFAAASAYWTLAKLAIERQGKMPVEKVENKE